MKKAMLMLTFIAAAYMLNAQVLYGTTFYGGDNNSGTICKLVTTNNTLTAAFSFDAVDGKNSLFVKLLQASDGKFYGMTSAGGYYNVGIIFSYDPATSVYTKLIDFDRTNGAYPYGSLIQASNGKLYGMTRHGGSLGYGVIFSYDLATKTYTKLKDFDGTGVGEGQPQGSLVEAFDGKLYGMTNSGGDNSYGTIFSYDPATSIYTKLIDFDGTNGGGPQESLIQASDGKLYGMTYFGGSNNYGVIFSYDPATATYTKLKDFDGTDGGFPKNCLMQASDGKLYGMTTGGGSNNYGVVFSYDPATSSYTKFIDFDGTNGYYPYGSLIQASDGKLYGTTSDEGSNNYGTAFSYDPATSIYTKLMDFDGLNGANPNGSLVQASDGKLYGVTRSGGTKADGVIFSFDPVIAAYSKLRDFGVNNNTGNYMAGALIKDQAGKLYGMASDGGSHGAGTIFSFDAPTAVFTKLLDFDGINGASPNGSLVQASDKKFYGTTYSGGINNAGVIFSYDPATSTYTKVKDFDFASECLPSGSLMQASDGKLYGMTIFGGIDLNGVIFSYDPATSTYTKVKDFNGTDGGNPSGSFIQALDGKLYGMTTYGGSSGAGVIFSFDPATSAYAKRYDFDYTNGASPLGNLIQASDGKLYGVTSYGGNLGYGVIFSYDPAASAYTKLVDFDRTNGRSPQGSLMQASDGKLYGTTYSGGDLFYNAGVIFSYDPATSTYAKLIDFSGGNGRNPQYTSFVEIPDTSSEVQISITDKSVIEGNLDRKFIAIPVILSEKSEKIIRFNYTTRNNTAKAGSDYIAQSGTLVFPPGLKRIFLPIRIKGDETPEANETFSIILSEAVNATIADSTSIVTILDDDASALDAAQEAAKTIRSISLSPNPAQDKVKIILTGYSGNVIIQLSSFDGKLRQQQKLKVPSSKPAQQQLNVSSYTNGIYLVTVVDEQGNRRTKELVIER